VVNRVRFPVAAVALVVLAGCQSSAPEHASEALPEDVTAADERADQLAGLVLEADWCETAGTGTAADALSATEVLVERNENRHLYVEHLEYDAVGCLTEMLVDAGGEASIARVVPAVVDVAAVPVGSVDEAVELLDVYLNGTYLEYVQEFEQGAMGQPGQGDAQLDGIWLQDMPDAAVVVSSVRDGGMYPGVWAWGLARTDTAVLKVEVRIELDGGWSEQERELRASGAADLAEELLREAHRGLLALTE
jgi:hypothetical protein